MALKFGKLARKFHPKTLMMSSFIPMGLVPPPEKRAWEYRVKGPWGMFKNDTLGICVIAAVFHYIMAATANTGSPAFFTDAEAVAVYSAVTGYDPSKTDANGNNPTDQGTAWTDMLAYWQSTGVTDANGKVHKILAWGNVGLSVSSLRQGISIFGGILVGTAITQSMMDQFNRKLPWNWPFAGGVLGGHGIPLLGYGKDGQTACTWDSLEQMDTKAPSQFDEAYAVVTQDFLDAEGVSPSGLDVFALTRAMKAIAA